MNRKKLTAVYTAPAQHWVGNGFPVRSLFSYDRHAAQLSPFLLLDHAGPMHFEPAGEPRGVGQHPHRGFETVTIVYAGEVAHRDSTGAGGTIGPGDVQWMTAASGILHDEFHSREFTERGGELEMVQLWVNLPAKDKMAAPGYQDIRNADIAEVMLQDGAGSVRVIAGEFDGHRGAARTFTPMQVWDVRMRAGHQADFDFVEGHTLAVVVLHGQVAINGEAVNASEVAHFDRSNESITMAASSDATVLILAGEPIDEPVAARGPFVMNSEAELRQAVVDFNRGEFGRMPA